MSAARRLNSSRRLLQIHYSKACTDVSKAIKVTGALCVQKHFGQDLLVELQVKDEGRAEGLHREAALSQMDGLGAREGGEVKTR